jgi:hypothetical protein
VREAGRMDDETDFDARHDNTCPTPERGRDGWAAANLLHQWVESLWTTPCGHGGGYARDCTRCIHETLHASDWLAAAAANVWQEGARAGHHSPLTWFALRQCNPYRADRVARGAS